MQYSSLAAPSITVTVTLRSTSNLLVVGCPVSFSVNSPTAQWVGGGNGPTGIVVVTDSSGVAVATVDGNGAYFDSINAGGIEDQPVEFTV